MKPFRFGVQTHAAGSGKEWRDMARRVEGLGYSTLYVPDHFGDQWSPEIAMAIAAEATESLNVGGLVFDNDYRHPVVFAKQMATIDLVTEGRLEVGIGAGWMKSDYDEAGMPYDEPRVRVDRFEEALQILKALWRDGSCTFEGEHYTIKGAQGFPRPVRQPWPRLLIGGGGKRVLSIAAREADIVGVNPNLKAGYVGPEVAASARPEMWDKRIGWVKEAAGDRLGDIELQVLTFLTQVVPNGAEVYENMAPVFGMTPEELRQVPIGMAGTADEIADMLRERREKWGFSYIVVQADAHEAFAPVVEKLAGT